MLAQRKGRVEICLFFILLSFLNYSLSYRKAIKRSTKYFPIKKGFINYVFCRNWAVGNPAGTRLDSSLVNKQVGPKGAFS